MKKATLAETHPELAKRWHQKNLPLTPDGVIAGSHKKVLWKCPKGDDHEWDASIVHVVKSFEKKTKTLGCPVCQGAKVVLSNCLLTTDPEIASSWHYEKNNPWTPADVTRCSNKQFSWQCSIAEDHIWPASVNNRIKQGCPFCSGKRVTSNTSLAVLFPEIAKQWDSAKNGKITPYDVTPGSNKKMYFLCEKKHSYLTRIAHRTSGSGCPFCFGKKLPYERSLEFKYPDLAKELHPTENENLKAFELHAHSRKKVWWLCSKNANHKWDATVDNRTKGNGCPFCANKKINEKNSLLALYPEIASQWCYPRNGQILPQDEAPYSNKKVWWQCEQGHIWCATISHRTGGTGCPSCNMPGWTIEKIRLFVQSMLPYINTFTPVGLCVLFNTSGSSEICKASKGYSFIQALKTGKFPKEELEKFVANQPSLVDKFLSDQDFSLQDDLPQNSLSEMTLSKDDDNLPIVQTKDVLASLDNKLISNADEETINFFIKEAVARIWQHAFINVREALLQLKQYNKNGLYPEMVKRLFMEEYNGAIGLSIPAGYAFEYQPNLMQLYTAYLIKSRKRIGNWSGTGAGKTLSAILASRVIGARLTIICCPNNVIDNWKEKLSRIYSDSSICLTVEDLERQYAVEVPQYLILNYEFFQHDKNKGIWTKDILAKLQEKYKVDFIIIDEIHFSKQREVNQCSIRKQVISSFVAAIGEKNNNLHVLGMSATPVINNLHEGKTLIELITGLQYDDLDIRPTVNNCVSLYKLFVSHGIRWVPRYDCTITVNIKEIDCKDSIEEIKKQCASGSLVDLEAILTKVKLPFILENLCPKTVIYTHYTKGILSVLQEAIQQSGWRVAIFTGEFKDGLKDFIGGNADVLIASSCVGTGIDGLQYVSHKMIINSLPWTHAEFEQLKGRLYRQGQSNPNVEIIVPLTYANINGEKWSWCDSRWRRIQFKKSIADAAVDGVIPEGHLRTPAQAYKDTMEWLKRLEAGEVNTIERKKIGKPLLIAEHSEGVHRIDYFSQMNSLINHQTSQQTQELFLRDPKSWHEYHAAFSEAREGWDVVPCQEAIKWCQLRPDSVIGDFGCGEAFLANELKNKVYSFDHVAINDKVIACDMCHVPLANGSLDAAIFSLSLMGENYIDYLKEARRCLKLDGQLWIAEPTSRINDLAVFKEMLERLGFFVINTNEMWKFTLVCAIKNTQEINDIALTELLKNKKILS